MLGWMFEYVKWNEINSVFAQQIRYKFLENSCFAMLCKNIVFMYRINTHIAQNVTEMRYSISLSNVECEETMWICMPINAGRTMINELKTVWQARKTYSHNCNVRNACIYNDSYLFVQKIMPNVFFCTI